VRPDRIACVRYQQFAVNLARRHDLSLNDKPFVIAERYGQVMLVLAVNEIAATFGVRPGMKVSHAESYCGGLVQLSSDPENERRATEQLAKSFDDVTPDIEIPKDETGLIFLNVAGLIRLHSTEDGIAGHIISTALKSGLPFSIGIAGNKYLAQLASAYARVGDYVIVAAEEEQGFLQGKGISDLGVKDDTVDTFHVLGVDTIGALQTIPSREILVRFKDEGKLIATRAAGKDIAVFIPRGSTPTAEYRREFDYPLGDGDPFLEELKEMLSRCFEQLTLQGRGSKCVVIRMVTDNRRIVQKRITLAQPKGTATPFLKKIALEYPSWHLDSGVRSLHIICEGAGKLDGEQRDILNGVDGASLGELAEQITTLHPNAAYLPEHAFLFRAALTKKKSKQTKPPLYTRGTTGLRVFTTPARIEIHLQQEKLAIMTIAGRHEAIIRQDGPWVLTGEWWREPYAREYFEIETARQERFLLFRDSFTRYWFLQGIYD
jgi:DNA polymerase IV